MGLFCISSFLSATAFAQDWVTLPVELNTDARLSLFLTCVACLSIGMTSTTGELESTSLCGATAEALTKNLCLHTRAALRG